MGRLKKLLSNTAIIGAGTFISKALVFFLMPLYTAYLSSAEFGIADILMQTANLIIPLAVLGINEGLFRFSIGTDEIQRKRVFSASILTMLAGMLPLALLIQILRAFSVYDGFIWLVFLYICSANLHLIVANYLRGCEKMKIFAIQGIVNTALVITLNVIFLVAFDMGVTGYVLSVVIADLLVSVFLIAYCRLYRDINFKNVDKGLFGMLISFSLPYIPTTLMWTITSVSDRFVIMGTLGEGAAAINGLYAAAYKLPTLITMAGGIFIKAWQISSAGEKNKKAREGFFNSVYRNYLSFMFVGGAFLVSFAKIMTNLLLDDSYYNSWSYVPILAIAMIFFAFSEFLGTVYFVEKKSMHTLLTATVGAVTNIALNFILIPKMAAQGAAIATAISYGVVFLIRVIDTKKYIKFDRAYLKTLINTVTIIAQAAIMVLEIPYWWIWQIGFILFMLLFNAKDVVVSALHILRKVKGRGKGANTEAPKPSEISEGSEGSEGLESSEKDEKSEEN